LLERTEEHADREMVKERGVRPKKRKKGGAIRGDLEEWIGILGSIRVNQISSQIAAMTNVWKGLKTRGEGVRSIYSSVPPTRTASEP